MTEWHELRLGDALTIKHGFAFKSRYFTEDSRPYIVLTPGNFHDGGGFKEKSGAEKYYDGPLPTGYVLEQGDVVIAMTEQAHGLLGSSATIPSGSSKYLHNQRIGLVCITDSTALDLRFVYHLFNTPPVRRQVQATATGSKVRHTAPVRIEDVRVAIPALPTQRRIAGVLDAVDDLIENNRQRIALLNEMAQATYREWFVQFRYPGYEDHELVDSSLGPIPTSWQIATVGQSFTTVLGGTPSRRNPALWNGEIPWLNSGKTNELRVIAPSEYITDLGLARSSTKLMPPKTTLVAITGATLGQVSILEAEMCANQSVVGIYDESCFHGEWIYRMFVDRINGIVQSASGGAQQHINKGIVEDVLIARPPEGVLAEFNEVAVPLGDEIATLLRSNRCLATIRDILLPKLVTGAVDVSHLDLEALLEMSAA